MRDVLHLDKGSALHSGLKLYETPVFFNFFVVGALTIPHANIA
jgi:hypothetical protein